MFLSIMINKIQNLPSPLIRPLQKIYMFSISLNKYKKINITSNVYLEAEIWMFYIEFVFSYRIQCFVPSALFSEIIRDIIHNASWSLKKKRRKYKKKTRL